MDERILACMESAMGIRVRSARPVLGGYLNAKWRVQSSLGALLVKQYSMTRFDPERLKALSWALAHQLQVQNVLPTARLIPHQGKALLNPAKGVYFVVMRYARGHTLETGRPTPVQIMDLGRVCARMHRAMRPLPGKRRQTTCGRAGAGGEPHEARGPGRSTRPPSGPGPRPARHAGPKPPLPRPGGHGPSGFRPG